MKYSEELTNKICETIKRGATNRDAAVWSEEYGSKIVKKKKK